MECFSNRIARRYRLAFIRRKSYLTVRRKEMQCNTCASDARVSGGKIGAAALHEITALACAYGAMQPSGAEEK